MKGDGIECCDNCAWWDDIVADQGEGWQIRLCFFDGSRHGDHHSCEFFISLKNENGITGAAVERLKNRMRELAK